MEIAEMRAKGTLVSEDLVISPQLKFSTQNNSESAEKQHCTIYTEVL